MYILAFSKYITRTDVTEKSLKPTHLLMVANGVKCCTDDIAKAQSNMTVAPLNCSTKHGDEAVFPTQYYIVDNLYH